MNFNELESLWGAQPPQPAGLPTLAELKRRFQPDIKRRGRLIAYELFTLGLGLVLTPVLAIANHRYAPATHPVAHWLHFAALMSLILGFLLATIRRWRRHQRLVRAGVETLAASTAQALTVVEMEMRDFRVAGWAAPVWLGSALVSAYLNNPVTTAGWMPFAGHAAVIAIFGLGMGCVMARHYRKNLKPEQKRRRELLAQLS